ncbi:MAG: class I SAM-dependent methyltransferase [archaeon]|jgi:ubiquinone/menaquinone biosynthesis C-methylase UbiE|nr:class I SAM-dependent methyltransferase [archaeon]
MSYYSEISGGYDKLHGEEQARKAAIINDNIALVGRLLDIGAGTGATTKLFEKNCECVALEPSIEMVKKYSGLKVVGRAEELPFKDKCFDSVVSLTALHHANLERSFAEIKRVSRPDAAVAVSFFKRAKNFGFAQKLFAGFRAIDAKFDWIFLNK